jgi:DNA-binding transcriptional LysR family regulator
MVVQLDDLTAFVAVARRLSFSRAAMNLGMSTSAISKTITKLEKRLDLQLLSRTTRSVLLTEAGAALLNKIGPHLDAVALSISELSETQASSNARRTDGVLSRPG